MSATSASAAEQHSHCSAHTASRRQPARARKNSEIKSIVESLPSRPPKKRTRPQVSTDVELHGATATSSTSTPGRTSNHRTENTVAPSKTAPAVTSAKAHGIEQRCSDRRHLRLPEPGASELARHLAAVQGRADMHVGRSGLRRSAWEGSPEGQMALPQHWPANSRQRNRLHAAPRTRGADSIGPCLIGRIFGGCSSPTRAIALSAHREATLDRGQSDAVAFSRDCRSDHDLPARF